MDLATLQHLQDSASLPSGQLDWIFLAYIGYGVIRGVFRGLAEELAGLVGTALVFLGSWRVYRPVAEGLRQYTRIENEALSQGAAYVVMFLLFMFVWKIVILLLHKALDRIFPKHLKRPGGALLGGMKSVVVLCVVLMAVQLSGVGFLKEKLVEGTRFGRFTQDVLPATLAKWWPGLYPVEASPPSPAGNAHGP